MIARLNRYCGEENAVFGQTVTKVGSFDGGWGASYMARIVGQKKRIDLVLMPSI